MPEALSRTEGPLRRQIASYFEREILNGHLSAGARLPATTEIARQFRVNPETVQAGLRKLSSQGLIERKPGHGTFVRPGLDARDIGIVICREMLVNPDLSFYRLYLSMLLELLEKDNWNPRFFITSEFASYDKTYYQLRQAVDDHSLRGIIEFCSNSTMRKFVVRECVCPGSVSDFLLDDEGFIRMGMDHLIRQGGKKIVFLHPSALERKTDVRKIEKEYAGQGVTIRRIAVHTTYENGCRTAYELLRSGETFDSLFIGNDRLTSGVLHVLIEKKIRIPEAFHLLTHSNRGIPIDSPVPLTRLEFDPHEMAQETCRMLYARIRGEKIVRRKNAPKLILGRSCGEQTMRDER